MDEVPDHVLENIASAVVEVNQLRKLSNEDLCREYLRVSSAGGDDELVVEELMTRLVPNWAEMEV